MATTTAIHRRPFLSLLIPPTSQQLLFCIFLPSRGSQVQMKMTKLSRTKTQVIQPLQFFVSWCPEWSRRDGVIWGSQSISCQGCPPQVHSMLWLLFTLAQPWHYYFLFPWIPLFPLSFMAHISLFTSFIFPSKSSHLIDRILYFGKVHILSSQLQCVCIWRQGL